MRLFQVHERLGKLLTVRSRPAGIILVTPQELAKYRSNAQKYIHTLLILPIIIILQSKLLAASLSVFVLNICFIPGMRGGD